MRTPYENKGILPVEIRMGIKKGTLPLDVRSAVKKGRIDPHTFGTR